MSRNNDGLPMLPPWLSESDVTQVGYEAPVQNLPSDDVIEEGSGRRRGRQEKRGRRWGRGDKNTEQPAAEEQQAPAPAPHGRAPESTPRGPEAPQPDSPATTRGASRVWTRTYSRVRMTHGRPDRRSAKKHRSSAPKHRHSAPKRPRRGCPPGTQARRSPRSNRSAGAPVPNRPRRTT